MNQIRAGLIQKLILNTMMSTQKDLKMAAVLVTILTVLKRKMYIVYNQWNQERNHSRQDQLYCDLRSNQAVLTLPYIQIEITT